MQRARTSGTKPAFQNLIVWQKAQGLAADVVNLVDALPNKKSANTLGNQVLRSAASVAANIAEGYGRYSEAAYRNHLSIARGSLFETESWLDLLLRTGYMSDEKSQQMVTACEEVARLLTAAMKPLRNAKSIGTGEEPAEYEPHL